MRRRAQSRATRVRERRSERSARAYRLQERHMILQCITKSLHAVFSVLVGGCVCACIPFLRVYTKRECQALTRFWWSN